MSLQEVVLFSTAMLAIVNLLGSAVLFAALAGKFDPGIQRRMANQSALAVLIILLVCAWLGNSILGLMGVTTPMLQAAGGIILLNYGLRMVTVEDVKLTHPNATPRATSVRNTGRRLPWCLWRFRGPLAPARSRRSSSRRARLTVRATCW